MFDYPAVDDQMNIYIALRGAGKSDNDIVFALASSGALLWQVELPPSNTRLTEGRVLFSKDNKVLSFEGYFINGEDGTLHTASIPEKASMIRINSLGQFVIYQEQQNLAYDFSSGRLEVNLNPALPPEPPTPLLRMGDYKYVDSNDQAGLAVWCRFQQEQETIACIFSPSIDDNNIIGEFTAAGAGNYRNIVLDYQMERMVIYTDGDPAMIHAVDLAFP